MTRVELHIFRCLDFRSSSFSPEYTNFLIPVLNFSLYLLNICILRLNLSLSEANNLGTLSYRQTRPNTILAVHLTQGLIR